MKIAAYTIGSIERASSRLRSFYLFDLANKFNIEVIRPSRYRDALKKDIDLVHIQKIISIGLPFMVILYRLKGIKVVYDLDDQPGRPNVIFRVNDFFRIFHCFIIVFCSCCQHSNQKTLLEKISTI